MPDPLLDRLALEFLERFWSDRDAGRSIGLEAYLQRFPEHEELIAREYLGALTEARGRAEGEREGREGPPEEGRIGPYRLLKELGRGGQGVVWLAEDTRLGRRVALKVLTGLGPGAELHLARFRREAALASKLNHPGICGVHDTGIDGGVPYIAMRYVEGETLAERLLRVRSEGVASQSSAISFEEGDVKGPAEATPESGSSSVDRKEVDLITAAFEKVARALHAAHELGIVHRDIKPGNIMITPEQEPVLLDFGLAQDDSDGAGPTLTKTGDVFGTPAYMSPEQITGRRVKIDRRSDVYSLGATLYESLTLKRPFEALTRESLYQAILSKEPERARKLNRRIPSDLEVVLQCAMSKDRDRRYQTAADLAEDLRRIRAGEPILAKKVSVLGRTWLWSKRRPAAAALVGALAIAIPTISGLGVWYWTHREDVRAQERARQEEGVEDAIDAGFEGLFHGTTEQALEAFERALAADAGSAEAVVGLALTQLRLESPKAALQVITDAERSVADPQVLARTKADILTKLGRQTEAARVMESAPKVEGSLMWFLEGLRALDAGHDHAGKNRDAAYHPAVDQAGKDSEAFYRRAIAHLTRAVASSPRARRPYHCQLAHAIGHGGGHTEAATAIAESLLELWPESGTAWHFADFALEGVGLDFGIQPEGAASRPDAGPGRAHGRSRVEEAIADARTAGSNRNTAMAYFDLGNALRRLGRLKESILAMRLSIKFNPDDDRTHANLGLSLVRLGRLEEGLDALYEARRLNPNAALTHANLGVALARQGKMEESLAANREAIRLDPRLPGPYSSLSGGLLNLGRVDEALPFIEEAVRLNPRDPDAQNVLGFYLCKKGRFEEAIAPLREVIRLAPDFPDAEASLRRALLKTGRADEALASIREAVRLKPGTANLQVQLAKTLLAGKRFDEAVAACREAIRLEPEGADGYRALGDVLCQRGPYAEGIESYRQSLRLRPDRNLAYNVGNGLNSHGLQDGAAEFIREAIRISPNYAEAHCNLAGILRDQGDAREALAEFRRGHDLGSGQKGWRYPSAEWVAMAEQRVAEEDGREAQLAAHLAAGTKPGSENELAVLAGVALRKGHRALAVEWFRAAFEEAPELAADLPSGHRRMAARAAVLASVAGAESRPAGTTPSALRLQALSWLEDEVASVKAAHAEGSIGAPIVRMVLVPLIRSPDFASVRGNDSISKLAAVEQGRWRKLWADADAVLASLEPKPETR